MHIRNIHTDKPTGVVTFLPMEGGDAVSGGSGEVARPSVPVVIQVDEPMPGVQEALRGEVPAVTEPVQEDVLSEDDRRLVAMAKDKSCTGQQRYENAARLIMNRAAREKAYFNIAIDSSIEHVKWRICALKAISSPVKKQKALFYIAKDSKIPYNDRLNSAESITNPNKKQKAFASIFTDPKLDLQLPGSNRLTQDKHYIKIRYNFLKNIPQGPMRDYILRKIVQAWGMDDSLNIRFSYKSFEYIKDLASNEIVKEKLFDTLLENKRISATLRNALLSRKEYDDYKKDTVFYNRSISSLGFIEEKPLEYIRNAINSASSIVSAFKKDTLLQIITEKWIIEPNAKIEPYISQFQHLYQLITSQESKNIIIVHLLDNKELPTKFHDAIKDFIEQQGDKSILDNYLKSPEKTTNFDN